MKVLDSTGPTPEVSVFEFEFTDSKSATILILN